MASCPICLEDRPGTCGFQFCILSGCKHEYCLPCINTWSVENTGCPICRKPFDKIICFTTDASETGAHLHGITRVKPCDRRMVESSTFTVQRELDELESCPICHLGERYEYDVMVYCDSCNRIFHPECQFTTKEDLPIGNWYCAACLPSMQGYRIPTDELLDDDENSEEEDEEEESYESDFVDDKILDSSDDEMYKDLPVNEEEAVFTDNDQSEDEDVVLRVKIPRRNLRVICDD